MEYADGEFGHDGEVCELLVPVYREWVGELVS